MRIYTRTGDSGETGLFGGQRVAKDDLRVDAFGDVDELNSAIGLARSYIDDADLDSLLRRIQNELFELGADLSTPEGVGQTRGRVTVPRVSPDSTLSLEQNIDRLEGELAPLSQFILPGGGRAGAHLHLARAVCRRAERRVVALSRRETVNPEIVRYLNRLSDLLFVAARAVNLRSGVIDSFWEHYRIP